MYPPHVQCSDAVLHADHIGLSLSPTNAHIKLPLHRLATAAAEGDVEAAEEQTGPPAKCQRVDDADTEPCSSSVLEACLSQFLASAEPSASEQNSVEAEID